MALFVRASRIAPMEEQALPPLAALSSAKPAMRGPGFFGRLGNRLRNADWQMAFAQMRDDPSFAENLLAHRENAAEQARREAEAESQRVAAKGQNEQRRAFIDTLPEGQRQAAWMDTAPFIAAQAPMTTQQRESFALDREQLDEARRHNRVSEGIGWANARNSGGMGGGARLTPQREAELADLRSNANTVRGIVSYLDRFSELGYQEPTGAWTAINPRNWGGMFSSPNRREMESLTAGMVPIVNALNRLPGSASDRDANRITQSLPNTNNDGSTNERIIRTYRGRAQNAQDYAWYSDIRSREGAQPGEIEQEWMAYVEANPILDGHGNPRSALHQNEDGSLSGRPTMEQWLQLPDHVREQLISNFQTENASDEEVLRNAGVGSSAPGGSRQHGGGRGEAIIRATRRP